MNKKKNIKKLKIPRIDKPWGFEEIVESNDKYTVKRIFMKSKCQCSYQYHIKKLETILVLSGELAIRVEGKNKIFTPGEFITIQPLVKHRMAALKENTFYIECSTSELDDVVRIEDEYGRI